jgi:hypothetical protein
LKTLEETLAPVEKGSADRVEFRARDAMRRGGPFSNDRYRVRMEVTPPDTEEGDPHYKILEVLDFTPAPQQTALPLRKPSRKPAKSSK